MGRGEFGWKGGERGAVGRRKQWTSRPAAGDLWTRHSVIALDPFVFKRSQRKRGGGGGGGGGGLWDRKWFTMTPIFQHFHPWPQLCTWFAGDGKDRVADVM